MDESSKDVIFVGGAPRSGTTVLQALICTSPRASRFVAECSYFTGFMTPLRRGLDAWHNHTRRYFDEPGDLMRFHGSILRTAVEHFRARLGDPEVLVLKDPMLTADFPLVAECLPEARFVVSVRDPRDTVLSRLDVVRRATGAEPTSADVEAACAGYNDAYAGVLHHRSALGPRLLLVPYAELMSGRGLDRFAALGLPDVDPANIIQGRWKLGTRTDNPWRTDLYGGLLSTDSVGRHKTHADPELSALILARCGETASGLGLDLG